MDAGPALDTLIEKYVFQHDRDEGEGLAQYSTTIEQAWRIVEKLTGHIDPTINQFGEFELMCSDGYWQARFGDNHTATWYGADTAPHAICLAALRGETGGG